MVFFKKQLSKYLPEGIPFRSLPFEKPQKCPHCGVCNDADYIKCLYSDYNETENPDKLLIMAWRCTICRKIYISFHLIRDNQCTYLNMYPRKNISFFDDNLKNISPAFFDMYNQALQAESNDNFELAAIGFRTSVEFLIKDYAINVLNESPDNVEKLNLYDAISKYLNRENTLKAADVVRILGNDFTHYSRKYPEFDFNIVKQYMDLFIQEIRTLIALKQPPVSRNS